MTRPSAAKSRRSEPRREQQPIEAVQPDVQTAAQPESETTSETPIEVAAPAPSLPPELETIPDPSKAPGKQHRKLPFSAPGIHHSNSVIAKQHLTRMLSNRNRG